MFRFDIINNLILKYKYSRYLEIGVKSNKNFDKIIIKHKYGVDPFPRKSCSYVMTSDDFFKRNNEQFDIIFIDGLHIKEQVLRDINNSLSVLSIGGTIVVHDCNPLNKIHALPTYDKNAAIWNGTTWEAFVELRMTRDDLDMCVVDTDHGCGIIRSGRQNKVPIQKITYELLEMNRKSLLNLIDVEEFKSWYS
jgi:hypothetical protein